MKDWGAPARLADDGANGVSFAGGGGGGGENEFAAVMAAPSRSSVSPGTRLNPRLDSQTISRRLVEHSQLHIVPDS